MDENILVKDSRVAPFTKVPPVGVKAIQRGELSHREISVYIVHNMIIDGMIPVNRQDSTEIEIAIARSTSLTVAQVVNTLSSLKEKGLYVLEDGETVMKVKE